jgi:pyruvate dehydrogenase E2 component (dihydrolipoamide acetyltransferase)
MPSEPLTDAVLPDPTPAPAGARGTIETVELSRAQRTVARRVAESKATIPDFQLAVEADVSEVLDPTEVLDRAGAAGVESAVVKAVALALREHPRVNGAYADGAFQLHSRINVGVAVAGPDTPSAPTIFDADQQPVAAIAEAIAALTAKVAEGAIASPDLAGGTFTITSLVRSGVKAFTPIITPGQAAGLAVGAPRPRIVPDETDRCAPTLRRIVTLTLSADHRIVYAAEGASFLARVCELLAAPAEL